VLTRLVVGFVLFLAAFLLCVAIVAGEDRKDLAPFDPFAEAAVGDWEVLCVKSGDKERYEEWTVTLVEDEKVTVRLGSGADARDLIFSRKTAPSLAELFPGNTFSGAPIEVKWGAATLPLSGEEFRCQKARFRAPSGESKTDGILYIAKTVKCAGVVSRSLDPGEKAELVGHGTKDKTVWGKTLKEATEKK
jgi:hypothetical protein